jgi:pimeloyl-ACP methyl ester carboxylesterase
MLGRHPSPIADRCAAWRAVAIVLAMVLATGCGTTKYATLRSVPHSPLVEELQLTARGGPQTTPRTTQLLRVYNLTDDLQGDPRDLLGKLQAVVDREPSPDKVYALAELAYLGAQRLESHSIDQARDLYGTSVLHAFRYLFDARFAPWRNPYDPQYRGACDLYNGALEAGLRIERKKNRLVPGQTATIQTSAGPCELTCVLRGSAWKPEEIERFEFVSDYQITGLRNHYQTYGLGVPMIAVRRSYSGESTAARYYPPNLSFPVTAFLRPLAPEEHDPSMADRRRAVLEFYDPLVSSDLVCSGVRVPLESDLTTPLAYFLSDPMFGSLATAGLLRPESLLALRPGAHEPIMGLYMVQPYEPGKIPVVMVHGLWSSPMTWVEMFNDLRSHQQIRQRYQFWFYLYPTGQPFWLSAAQFRRDLAAVREVVDPQHLEPALDQMVLVGHSMGGLVSRLQTVTSGDEYWKAVSNEPLSQVRADAEVRAKLEYCFYFQPNPSVRRVITIGTPHRGSSFSNQTTQWLLGKLINLPQTLVASQQQLFRENPNAFPEQSLLRISTSIDSLNPVTSIFPVLLASPTGPWVRYHNIIGQVPQKGLFGYLAGDGDGVVSVESARIAGADSEITVPADHTTVQTHPLAVLEVRRILLEHLAELEGRPVAGPSPWIAQQAAPAVGR